MLAAGQYSAKQDRRIDRRYLRVPHPLPGVDICEVIKESPMCGQLMPKKRQGLHDPRARCRLGDEATLLRNADCGQAKPRGSNTGSHAFVFYANVATVLDQSGL